LKRVFIIGLPRSGTTWVAKTFDAAPDVIYRHEPDSAVSNTRMPQFVEPARYDAFVSEARDYVSELFGVSTLKTCGAQPWFEKSYRSRAAEFTRSGIVAALRAAEAASFSRRWARRQRVPDFVTSRARDATSVVVKSVIAAGRAGLYARALPDVRFLAVIRHPCGFVASQLRGADLGLLSTRWPVQSMADTEQARRRGLTVARLEALTPEEIAAWYWVIANEAMFEGLEGRSNAAAFAYDLACLDPGRYFEDAFAHAELPMQPQTRAFIDEVRDRPPDGSAKYYSLFRNPRESSQKWRQELSPAQIDAVLAIAGESEVLSRVTPESGTAPAPRVRQSAGGTG